MESPSNSNLPKQTCMIPMVVAVDNIANASNIQNRLSVSFITTTDFYMLHGCRRFRVQQYQGLSIA